LTIVEQGFGQVNGASEAGYGFVVQNPLTDATLESSAYTITALDAHGATVATEQGTIDVVLPGAKLGVGGSLFPSDSAAVASIQVTVAAGVAGTLSMSPPSFTTDNPTYFGAESYPFVTGVIGNPLPTPLQDLAIYALLRDDSGAIIGGGSGLLDFAPPNGMAGVSAYVSGSAPPASVELYPALTASTLAATTGVVPDGARDLILAKTGWGATENVVAGYGFIVKNPNTDLAIQNARYQVVVYDAAGVALERTASSIAVLLPGESLGLAGTLYLPSGYAPAHVEIQLLTGAYVDPNGLADPFTTADVGYVPTNAPSVTGTVANASATDQANVMVYALAYSNDGSIIGGGSTVLQTIVAGGQETVEIGFVANGVPAKVELYAAQDPAAQ
jgi:hypothetical protein